MVLELSENERRFFEYLIEFYGKINNSDTILDNGILEDDLRVVKMKVKDKGENFDVEEAVDSLLKKKILEKRSIKKKSGGIERKDESNTLHTTRTKEETKYVFTNSQLREEIKERIQ